MDHDDIAQLQGRHPSWRLLRAANAPLTLAFLGDWFVERNNGPTAATTLTDALDDLLHGLNVSVDADLEQMVYPRPASEYLTDWSGTDAGWLRRFYPHDSDEIHYDATPAFERAYAWVDSLRARSFVGTESRLHTVVELLRQIVQGVETDPQARLVDLHRRRAEIDAQIAEVEAGNLVMLDGPALRDRYQQFSGTARELLGDFREVEENFRALDRQARVKIATWDGVKAELLAELVGDRADISGSDQGRSFQAFYDFLLSSARQDELAGLLGRVQDLDDLDADPRLRSIHHDWADAAERAQATVRQISEQLSRFLEDQVWENRRVLELIRGVETAALACRDRAAETGAGLPGVGMEIAVPGVTISLPFERPLYAAGPAARVDSAPVAPVDEQLDVTALLIQQHVDPGRLATQIRSLIPEHTSAFLDEIVALYPVEQGAAELLGYLALAEEDLTVEVDPDQESLIDYEMPGHDDAPGRPRRARMPRVSVTRR